MDFSSFLGTMKYYVKRISTLAAVETEAYVQKLVILINLFLLWPEQMSEHLLLTLCATLGKEDKKLPICLYYILRTS